jgi:hypothetical protein
MPFFYCCFLTFIALAQEYRFSGFNRICGRQGAGRRFDGSTFSL